MKYTLLSAIFMLLIELSAAQKKSDQKAVDMVSDVNTSASINKMILQAGEVGKLDTSAADKIFRQAIAAANKTNNPYYAGKAFYEMGEMYFKYKNHNKSFGSFFNARDFFNKAGAEKEAAYSLFGLGRQQ